MPTFRNLVGHRFGKLRVLHAYDHPNGHWRWHCQCDCGNSTIVVGAQLMRGGSRSCGCYHATLPIKVIAETDKAYAAGLIDGEGSISARRASRVRISFAVTIAVTMCDRNPIDWLAATFGGALKIERRHSTSGKQIFSWKLYCRKASAFLLLIEPYLKIKRKRALLAIELADLAKIPSRYMTITPAEIAQREKLVHAIHTENSAGNGRNRLCH